MSGKIDVPFWVALTVYRQPAWNMGGIIFAVGPGNHVLGAKYL